MPHKDPDKRRKYARDRMRKRRKDEPEKIKEIKRASVFRRWPVDLVQRARTKSKQRKHDLPTVTVDWILAQPLVCPYTGLEILPPDQDEHAGEHSPLAPSLDRVDNTKGYHPGNVRLTCMIWNIFRGEMNVDDAVHLWQILIKRIRTQDSSG